MQRNLCLILTAVTVLLLAACSMSGPDAPHAKPETGSQGSVMEMLAAKPVEITEDHAPNQLIVGYESEVDLADILAHLKGARVLREIPQAKAALVELPADMTAGLALRQMGLVRPDGLRYAEPNFIIPAPQPVEDAISVHSLNDPLLGKKWDLEAMNAFEAWETEVREGETPTGDGIVIAVHDTGIDGTHPDLSGRFVAGFDATGCYTTGAYNPGAADAIPPGADATQGLTFAEDPADREPFTHIHGTHVAGISSAIGDNAHGVAGVAHRSLIMDLKGFCFGFGFTADLAISLLAAMFDATGDGIVPDVINMSWGGRAYSQLMKDVLDMGLSGRMLDGSAIPAFDETGDNNPDRTVTFVSSMGNSGTDERMYPTGYPGIISVGATEPTGKANFTTMGLHTDITAPGVDILSTWPSTIVGPDGKAQLYYRISGTSMSGPQVAGAAALIKQFHPELSAYQVRELLMRTANDAPPFDVHRESGAGLLDLKALADELAAIENGGAAPPAEGGVGAVAVTTDVFTDVDGEPNMFPLRGVDVFLFGDDPDGNEAAIYLAKTNAAGVAYFQQIDPGNYDLLVAGEKITDADTFAFFPEHRASATGDIEVAAGTSFVSPSLAHFPLTSTLEVTLRWTGGGDLDLAILECVPVAIAPENDENNENNEENNENENNNEVNNENGMTCAPHWATAKDPGPSGQFDQDDQGTDVTQASETYTLDPDHLPTPYIDTLLDEEDLPPYYFVSMDATNVETGQQAYLTITLNGETFLDDFGPLPVVPGAGPGEHLVRLMDYLPRGLDHAIPVY